MPDPRAVSIDRAIYRSMAAAERAAQSLNLRRGRIALASVVTTAPLIGLLLTVQFLIGLFGRSFTGERNSVTEWVVTGTTLSLVPTCICLATGLLAVWGLAWIDARAEAMELEIRKTLALLEAILRRWPGPSSRSTE